MPRIYKTKPPASPETDSQHDAHTSESEHPPASPKTDSPVASQHDAYSSNSEPATGYETDSSICSLSDALTSDSEPSSEIPKSDGPVASLSGGDSEAGDDAGAEKAVAWLEEAKLLKPLYAVPSP